MIPSELDKELTETRSKVCGNTVHRLNHSLINLCIVSYCSNKL